MLRAVYVCVATTLLLALSAGTISHSTKGPVRTSLSAAPLPPEQPALLLADGPSPLPPPYPTARVA